MKEIPLIFSTPMVAALLEGRKTQTRRIAAVPVGDHYGTDIMDWGLSKHPYQENGKWLYSVQSDVDDYNTFELKPKYGAPGYLIWVREAWGVGSRPDPFVGSVDGFEFKADEAFINEVESLPIYPCDGFDFGNYDKKGWRPSIHMPKIAARIWLQVTGIKVERLQDIKSNDVLAEGAGKEVRQMWLYGLDQAGRDEVYRRSFEKLWVSINGPESWQANPWVWCVSFKVLSTTGHP